MSVPNATMTFWLIRAQVRVRLLATLISPFGHGVDDPSRSRRVVRRRLKSSTVPLTPAIETTSPLLNWFSMRIRRRSGSRGRGSGRRTRRRSRRRRGPRRPARCRARTRPGSSAPRSTKTKNRMTLPPSWSSVSIRFRTSIADSSWAVPSVASRSISALRMPWTREPGRVQTRGPRRRRSSRIWKPSVSELRRSARSTAAW